MASVAFGSSPLRAAPIARPNQVIASACANGVFGIASAAASAQAARSNAYRTGMAAKAVCPL